MCTDTHTATDLDTEKFILIRPCGDLCHAVRINRSACPSIASLFVPFNTILSCQCNSMCDPAMPKNSKIMKQETKKLREMVQENVAL